MNEQVGESGAKNEQEAARKKQEDKNAVQAPDLLVRRRQVYPKKPRYNLLTPDQLKDKKKAAWFMQKEVVSSSGMRKALLIVSCTILYTLKKIVPSSRIFNNC